MSRFDFEPFNPDQDDWMEAGQTVNEGDLDAYIDLHTDDLAPFADWSRPRWRNRQKHDPARPSPMTARPSPLTAKVGNNWFDDAETIAERLKRQFRDDPEMVMRIEDIESEATAMRLKLWKDR